MTSKEKIKEIEDFIDFLEEKCIITSSDTAKTRLNISTILKDLEILEILKRKINIRAEFDTWRQKYISIFYGNLTNEEKEKIMRWLDGKD